MSSEGWFKFHRGIFDSDIWTDVTTFRLFIYLIGKASHKDGLKRMGLTLNKGQYVRSYRKLADDLSYKEGRGHKKYSLNTIKRCIQKLIDAERVNVKETEVGTLFTVVNYAKYQGLDDVEQASRNTSNDEVRTNGELMENEVRTNGEQYQELKNLRIKELEEDVEEDVRVNALHFYQQNFGTPSPFIMQSIVQWIDDLHEEVVVEAMKESLRNNARSFKYCESILRDWSNKGIRTVDDIKKIKLNNVTPIGERRTTNGKQVQQHSGRNGKSRSESSITGGQVGRLRPRRRTI